MKTINYLKQLMLLMVFFSSVALTHPHSFITIDTQFITEQDQLTAVRFSWEMDEMTSMDLRYAAKADPDSLADEVLNNIFDNHFFSEFVLKSATNSQIIHLIAESQDAKLNLTKSKAVVTFTAKLAQPIALAGNQFELITYEKTFYVDMYYTDQKNIHINAANCHITLSSPSPDDAVVNYASELDQDETPIESEGFILGKLFAQKVILQCS